MNHFRILAGPIAALALAFAALPALATAAPAESAMIEPQTVFDCHQTLVPFMSYPFKWKLPASKEETPAGNGVSQFKWRQSRAAAQQAAERTLPVRRGTVSRHAGILERTYENGRPEYFRSGRKPNSREF